MKTVKIPGQLVENLIKGLERGISPDLADMILSGKKLVFGKAGSKEIRRSREEIEGMLKDSKYFTEEEARKMVEAYTP